VAPEAATKAILYAALLPTVGASAAFLLVLARLPVDGGSGRHDTLESSIRGIGLVAAILVVVALLLRAWAQSDAMFGLADSFSADSFHTILTSRWGLRWHWQLLAAVSCSIAYACAGGGRRAAWLAAAAASVALCVSLTLTGHAAADPVRMAIHAAHLVGGGVWLGTLAALFRRFSMLALAGAGLAVAAGATAALIYVGAFENLWATVYGRTLLVKLALVGGAASCGYLNWRRVRSDRLPSSATAELLFALAIVVVTAVLTELEHP
jgi:putative copper export protein